MKTLDLTKMQKESRHFTQEREWDQYQTPKNMAIALTVEASELMEIFQWLSDQEVFHVRDDEQKMQKIKDELSDVLYWVVRLSDVLNIDLDVAFWAKLKKNAEKYPVELCKGKSTKYTEL